MTTSITVADTPLIRFTLARADDALVLGHRLSEWIGHGPILEEEMALGNIGLDLIGQARSLYQYVGELAGSDEDQLAFFRDAGEYRNALLTEQPNGDFGHTMVRQLFYSAYADPFWRRMMASTDPTLAAIAAKSEKESAYHLRHASEWVIRLGDGTAESHARAQAAVDRLWPYTGELFDDDSPGPEIAPDPATLRSVWTQTVGSVLARGTLRTPDVGWMQSGGRHGRHSEHLGLLLAVMQSVPRAHPGATW